MVVHIEIADVWLCCCCCCFLQKRPYCTNFLRPPKRQKEILISPPQTPPSNEVVCTSTVDGIAALLLQAAIVGLSDPGTDFELFPGNEEKKQPKIVLSVD